MGGWNTDSDDYIPSQIPSPEPDYNRELRSTQLLTPANEKISSLYAPGAVLDSQVTDSQWVRNWEAQNDRLSSKSPSPEIDVKPKLEQDLESESGSMENRGELSVDANDESEEEDLLDTVQVLEDQLAAVRIQAVGLSDTVEKLVGNLDAFKSRISRRRKRKSERQNASHVIDIAYENAKTWYPSICGGVWLDSREPSQLETSPPRVKRKIEKLYGPYQD